MDEIKKNSLSDLPFLKNITIVEDDEEIDDFSTENVQENLKQQQYEKSGVSKRFFNVSLENYTISSSEEQKAKYETSTLIKNIKNGGTDKILLLYGTYGTGKTHLACSVIRECGGCYRTAFKLVIEYENCTITSTTLSNYTTCKVCFPCSISSIK